MKKIFFSFLLVFCLLEGVGCALNKTPSTSPAEKDLNSISQNTPAPQDKSSKTEEVALSFNFGNDEVKNFTLQINGEESVYDLLTKLANQNQIKLETQESSLGILIQAIDGVKNGQDNKYWIYYINGQMANVGVKDQKVSPHDQIEFKFESNPF